MSSYSPWGAIQDSTQITLGVRWVSTASHGGLMVSRTAAAKYLSEQAIKAIHSTRSAEYVCFEEDCEYAIAFFERPEWDRFLKEKDLREWRAIAANTWTYPPDSYMGKAALECIPKVEARTDGRCCSTARGQGAASGRQARLAHLEFVISRCSCCAGRMVARMIPVLYAVAILAQGVYWLCLRGETERLAEVYWLACLYPGGRQ